MTSPSASSSSHRLAATSEPRNAAASDIAFAPGGESVVSLEPYDSLEWIEGSSDQKTTGVIRVVRTGDTSQSIRVMLKVESIPPDADWMGVISMHAGETLDRGVSETLFGFDFIEDRRLEPDQPFRVWIDEVIVEEGDTLPSLGTSELFGTIIDDDDVAIRVYNQNDRELVLGDFDSMEAAFASLKGGESVSVDQPGTVRPTGVVDVAAQNIGVYAEGRIDAHFMLSGDVRSFSLYGITGSDITGNRLANFLRGDDSDNVIDGGGKADDMRGGGGDDTYIVDRRGDLIYEEPNEGRDSVVSDTGFRLPANVEDLTLTDGAGRAPLFGNELENLLRGNDAANRMTGVSGADTLRGGGGNDRLGDPDGHDTHYGGDGDDVYRVRGTTTLVELDGEGFDTVRTGDTFNLAGTFVEALVQHGRGDIDGTGNALANRIVGNGGDNVLRGGGSRDRIAGNDGADALYGDDGRDILSGGAGGDTLSGGAGSDRINGGDGADVLSGGAGRDVFVFTGAAGSDRITDFEDSPGAERRRDGLDLINLVGLRDENHGAPITMDQLTLIQVGTSVQIGFGLDGETDLDEDGRPDELHIELLHVELDTLSAEDFLF